MSDFEPLMNLDIMLALMLSVVWGVASVLIGRHPARRSARRPRIRPIVLLVAIALGTVLVGVRTWTAAQMGAHSWLFAADRVVVALPIVGLPVLAALALSVPRLLAEARDPTPQARLATFQPVAVLPIWAALTGALVGFSGTIFVPLAPPLARPASTIYVVDALVLAAAWWWQRRRCAMVEGYHRRKWTVRILRAAGATAAALVVLVGALTLAQRTSRLPEQMSMASHDHATTTAGVHPVSVTDLTGPAAAPQRRFTLTAQAAPVRLASGRVLDGWTFNGQVPGPEIRVRQGDQVEVTVRNELTDTDVAVHWHGIDVPNSMDGVPGVTQDAIRPGGSFVYRFQARDAGTYWYHSHSQGSVQVKKGLFGALIVDPADGPAGGTGAGSGAAADRADWLVAQHTWYTGPGLPSAADLAHAVPAFGTTDGTERRTAAPGTTVRLRLLNTDSLTRNFVVTGTPFRVVAIDGNAVNRPTDVHDVRLVLGAGARYDVEFAMPDHPVRLSELRDPAGGIVVTPDGTGDVATVESTVDFDPTRYGTPAPTPFGPDSRFTREYEVLLDNHLGFYDGRFTFLWTMNGRVFPDVPPVVVREGDLVKLTYANRSHYDHPMHLHGHHMLVLSRNGKPVTGSPLWLDTVTVRVGEVWAVAFRADNPGIWMDHCHIFEHAADGMMTHVMYEGVTSPFQVGSNTPNDPE